MIVERARWDYGERSLRRFTPALARRKAAFFEEISRVGVCWEVRYPSRNWSSRGLNPLNGHRTRWQANDVHRRKCGANGIRLKRRHQHPRFAPKDNVRAHHDRGEFPFRSFEARVADRSLCTITRTRCPAVGREFGVWTGASKHNVMKCSVIGGFGRPGRMKLKAQILYTQDNVWP